MTELSVKLDKLYTQNSSLKDQVDKTSELINVSSDVQPSPGLSSRVEGLSEQSSQLQNKVNQVLDSLKNINQPLSSLSASDQDGSTLQSNIAVDLADELADRESRKCNLIVYNLSESPSPNAEADKSLFGGLCNSLGLDAHISTVTRLGKKVPDKIRPLRVCLDNEATKRRILSRSSQLRSKAKWENVYVNPDMTLAERNANKLLRQELKERRNRGEKYLVIRKNKIVSLNKSQSAPMDVSQPTPRSEAPSIPASGSHAPLSSSNHDDSVPHVEAHDSQSS